LQRLENYEGIVLVTTNLGENIDSAFQRRMDVVVPFFSPQPDERLRILELHLPNNHLVESDYLEQVALRCDLTGAQIRNAALHATLLALETGGSIDRYHLEEALQSEFRKAGGTYPLSNNHIYHDDMDGGIEAFVNALRSQ
jgi:SpoVK/Ycf46/Vps4 family AAA+-type ATPase